MKAIDRLASVDRSTPAMRSALPDLPMEPTVMIRLMRISVVSLGQFFNPVFLRLGIAENAFHVLCLLMADQGGSASPSDLSELVGTSRANMTRILDNLGRDGLVSRSTLEMDGRRAIITITPKGREIATATASSLREPLNEAFSGLSDEEFTQLALLLRKATKSFDRAPIEFGAAA